VLFDGVVHRQVVLLVPKEIRPLFLAEPKLLNAFADAEARAVQPWVAPWRRKKTIKVGMLPVLHVHGREGISLPLRLDVGSEIGAALRRLAPDPRVEASLVVPRGPDGVRCGRATARNVGVDAVVVAMQRDVVHAVDGDRRAEVAGLRLVDPRVAWRCWSWCGCGAPVPVCFTTCGRRRM